MLVRPGLERLRDLVTEGQIETLLIYSPDRLSRKYAYQVLLVEEFSRHGVDVVFLKSAKATTPEEELMLQFQGMIAEYERAQITERTRRGKKHRAKAGSVNVLSGAPFGFRYVKKTEISSACYEVIEKEAEIVRKVFWLYLEDGLSINAIARWLNDKEIPTRRGISRWERSTVWGMLRNPAYRGTACFGKTERAERQKLTRPLRMKGGFSPRCSCSRERPRAQWVEIGVPAIINEAIFAQAQERLELNKRFSPRRTIEATLLQGMLVCGECGHAFYRTSTRTSKRKLYYYRCLGSDDYRYPTGRVCSNRPVRQDYLDEIVWRRVLQLLEDPELIRAEIERRLQEIQHSNPTRQKKEVLTKQIARSNKSIEKLLDAYQEDLLHLEELRNRMPELRRREKALRTELQSLDAAAYDQQTFLRLAGNIEHFLGCLRETADTMDVKERQKIVRLVVKEVLVEQETIKIKHSIPVKERNNPPPKPSADPQVPSYLLRSGSHNGPLRCTAFGCPSVHSIKDVYFEEGFQQFEHAPVRNVFANFMHKQLVRDTVKVGPDIRIHYMDVSGFKGLLDLSKGILAPAIWSKTIAPRQKFPLKDRFYGHAQCRLHHTVPHGGYPKWPLILASRFVNEDSPDTSRAVGPTAQFFFESGEVCLKIPFESLDALMVRSRTASICPHAKPCGLKRCWSADLIDQAEPHISFHPSFGGLQHALCPYRPFHPVPTCGLGFSRLLSRFRHCRRYLFVMHGHCSSIFLHPFAPQALPCFHATMDALTPARMALRHTSREYQPFSGQVSPVHGTRTSMHSVTKHLTRPAIASSLPAQRDRLPGAALMGSPGHSRSGLHLESGGSPQRTAESCSLPTDCMFVSGCSPPRLAATQLPLTTGSEHLPGGDFHPSDRARFQAHGPRMSPG